jgi:regulator of protease activity HflC (stomatin/prohibitin superfamily)
MIDEALNHKSGVEAAQFLLGQRYIDAYQKVAKKENTIIIPSEPINVGNQISETLGIFKKVQAKNDGTQ